MEQYHGTTILSVRRGDNNVCLGGDGQVTLGNIVVKGTAKKVRRLYKNKILAGFAGGTADVHARHLFAYQILRKRAHALGRHLARVVIAGVERRDNSLIFRKVYCFHCALLVFALVSALDCTHRDAPREIFLEDEEHDDDRHGGKGCARHDEAEVRRIFRLHLRNAQRNGQILRA